MLNFTKKLNFLCELVKMCIGVGGGMHLNSFLSYRKMYIFNQSQEKKTTLTNKQTVTSLFNVKSKKILAITLSLKIYDLRCGILLS